MTVLVFLVMFFALFGPKLFGVIDLSMLSGLAGLAILLPQMRHSRIPSELGLVLFFLFLILVHTTLVTLVSGGAELYPLMRHVRAFTSTLLLGVFFYNVAVSQRIGVRTFLNVVLYCLVVNAAAILAQIYWPFLKPVIAGLTGFDKHFVALRGFGLTAGYDTAGYLCIFGAVMSAMCAYLWRGIKYQALLLVFLAAAVFTSRSTMALALVTAIAIVMFYLVKGRPSLKFNAAVLGVSGAALAAVYVLPLLAATFAFAKGFTGSAGSSEIDFVSSFAATKLSDWRESMWILPRETLALIVGAGSRAPESDVGYVKLVFMIGVTGLVTVSIAYLALFSICRRILFSGPQFTGAHYLGTWIIVFCAGLFISLLLVINIKNLYFLTRIYHELIVILVFFAVGLKDRFQQQLADGKLPAIGQAV